FDLDDKKFQVDVELFQKILRIGPRVPDKEFIVPPFHESLLTFLIEIGYKGPLEQNINPFPRDRAHIPTQLRIMVYWEEAYQTYLTLSNHTILPKKGRGRGGKGNRAIVTLTKKRSITADDNILSILGESLKLQNSINRTKAEIAEEERRVHETHERLGSKSERNKSDEKYVNEGEVKWLSIDDEEKDDHDEMPDDDTSIYTKEIDDERTKSENDYQEMTNAEKINAEKLKKEKGDKEKIKEKQANDDQAQEDQAEDDKVGALVTVRHKEKPEVPPSRSSLSLSSKYDVQIQQEMPFVLSAPLLDVLVLMIPKQTTPTPTLITPLPKPPIISEAPTNTTTIPDPLLAAIKASVQANVINEVKNQLPKFLPKMVSDFVNPRLKSTVRNVLQKTPALLAQSSFTPGQSPSKVDESLFKYELKNILFDKMDKIRSYMTHDKHQQLYDAL
nr:hypothetical protein [Tanacetum cinerariifolium]